MVVPLEPESFEFTPDCMLMFEVTNVVWRVESVTLLAIFVTLVSADV